jgi:hypothetical protein
MPIAIPAPTKQRTHAADNANCATQKMNMYRTHIITPSPARIYVVFSSSGSFCDIHRNPPCLILAEQLCRRAATYRLANFLRRAKNEFMPIAAK